MKVKEGKGKAVDIEDEVHKLDLPLFLKAIKALG